MMSSVRRQHYGMMPDVSPALNPIQRFLDDRNLLRSRSPLGTRSTALLGRSTLSIPLPTPLPTATPVERRRSLPVTGGLELSEPEKYEDILERRLEQKTRENFEVGIAYFRNRDPLKARHYFELTEHVWADRPQPYIGGMLASVELGDFSRAMTDLLRALDRAETLGDLVIPDLIDRFYEGEDHEERLEVFRRRVDSINILVNSQAGASRLALLLAYYSWLDGDVSTAISAAEESAGVLPEARAESVRKFHGFLVLEQQQPAAEPES
jgi:hypothetical protein